MIYGRFGERVEVVRMAVLEDVRLLDKRKPDKQDREAIAAGSYVVTKILPGGRNTGDEEIGQERIHHLAYLRADGAFPEIMAAVRAVGGGDKS